MNLEKKEESKKIRRDGYRERESEEGGEKVREKPRETQRKQAKMSCF